MNKYLVTAQFKVLSDTSEGAEAALKGILSDYPASWWILSSQREDVDAEEGHAVKVEEND